MSIEPYSRLVRSQAEAHEAASAAYVVAKIALGDGDAVWIKAEVDEADRTLKQNRYYWGPCLTEISEQARILGVRYVTEAWHELFKRQFLGFEVIRVQVAGRKKSTMIRRLRSTTDLKVKAMSDYLEKVQAFAVDELGVMFSARAVDEFRGTQYVPRRQKLKELTHETVA